MNFDSRAQSSLSSSTMRRCGAAFMTPEIPQIPACSSGLTGTPASRAFGGDFVTLCNRPVEGQQSATVQANLRACAGHALEIDDDVIALDGDLHGLGDVRAFDDIRARLDVDRIGLHA